MTINVENIPICDCHNEKKVWKTDSRKKSRGYWVCNRARQKSRRIWRLKQMRINITNKLKELENAR